MTMHGLSRPSDWVTRWAGSCPRPGRALDLACGGGRHLRWLAGQGWQATGVDRDREALSLLAGLAELIEADLEDGPWPLAGRQFDLIVVTNYLWRPLWAPLLASLAPGGLLVYETFSAGHESVGRPSRADFLLQPGELLTVAQDLRVRGYEDGCLADPPRFVQRIAAQRPAESVGSPSPWPLPGLPGALG